MVLVHGCHLDNVDLTLVVDSSGSIGISEFRLVKTFLKDLSHQMEIGMDKARMGLIEFSSDPENVFWMNSHFTKAAVDLAIDRAPFLGLGTDIAGVPFFLFPCFDGFFCKG